MYTVLFAELQMLKAKATNSITLQCHQ